MKISEAKQLITEVFSYNIRLMESSVSHRAFIVPCLIGDPGVGKTAAIMQAAEELEVPYHQTIVAQFDAGELGGIPVITDVEYEVEDGDGNVSTIIEKRSTRTRPDHMPDHMLPEGQLGFWNLDELAQAFLAQQNICSQIVNQWRIGKHEVAPGITIVATSNKPENKAGTTPMPSHLRDRLTFITIEPDADEFLAYAAQQHYHPDVCAFIERFPACLHKFEVGANAFPTARSWQKSSAILSLSLAKHIRNETLNGQIGEAMTTTFIGWLDNKDRMPDPVELCRNPMNAQVFGSEDADVLYLLIHNLVEIATIKNLGGMIAYLKRLPNQEFIAMWSRAMIDRHPELNETDEMTKFKMTALTKVMI